MVPASRHRGHFPSPQVQGFRRVRVGLGAGGLGVLLVCPNSSPLASPSGGASCPPPSLIVAVSQASSPSISASHLTGTGSPFLVAVPSEMTMMRSDRPGGLGDRDPPRPPGVKQGA